MMIDILSLFPEYFIGPFGVSIIKRAQDKGLLSLKNTDIRDFAEGKHKKVDDRPYGGGPGMVLMPEPLCRAIRSNRSKNTKVVYLSPQGNVLNARKCEELAMLSHLVLVCGHYEGIDERVIEMEIDEEISIGDYVLTSGCAAAVVLIDAVVRFIPGVLGNEEAAMRDSFQENVFDFPQYTRPPIFEGRKVPEVLLNGNHREIEEWRSAKAIEKTMKIRPDLCGKDI